MSDVLLALDENDKEQMRREKVKNKMLQIIKVMNSSTIMNVERNKYVCKYIYTIHTELPFHGWIHQLVSAI